MSATDDPGSTSVPASGSVRITRFSSTVSEFSNRWVGSSPSRLSAKTASTLSSPSRLGMSTGVTASPPSPPGPDNNRKRMKIPAARATSRLMMVNT
jgi:hypothetical protein